METTGPYPGNVPAASPPMTVEEALVHAANAEFHSLRTHYPLACRVLAKEVERLKAEAGKGGHVPAAPKYREPTIEDVLDGEAIECEVYDDEEGEWVPAMLFGVMRRYAYPFIVEYDTGTIGRVMQARIVDNS